MSFGPEERLAFCCPGRSKEWTPIGSLYHENEPINAESKFNRIARVYEDFVYSKRRNQLLCTTKWGHFESWDLADPLSPKMNWKKVDRDMAYDKENYPWSARSEQEYKMKSESWKYLVFAERSNRVFLVTRHAFIHMGPDGSYVEAYDDSLPYKTVAFDVHELVVDDDSLRFMDATLDGMAFFIGSTGHGFVMEEEDEMVTNNVEPDSIYFTDLEDISPPHWDKDTAYGGHDLGISNYRDKTFSPCYYPCDYQSIRRIDPAPL